MDLIHQVEVDGKTVKVYVDPDPLDPRKEWDQATTIAHWHRRYELGDKRIDQCSAADLRDEQLRKEDPILAILPLNLYDHCGLSVSTGVFSCSFDSGQVGWVYITQSSAEKMGMNKWSIEQLEQVIRDEIKTYDDYLTGQIFGYEVEGKDGEVIESLWGIVGDSEEALKEGKAAAETCSDPAIARELEEEKRKHNLACIIQNAWVESMGTLIERAHNAGMEIIRADCADSKWVATIADEDGESDFFFQTDKELRAYILGFACALNQGKSISG